MSSSKRLSGDMMNLLPQEVSQLVVVGVMVLLVGGRGGARRVVLVVLKRTRLVLKQQLLVLGQLVAAPLGLLRRQARWK